MFITSFSVSVPTILQLFGMPSLYILMPKHSIQIRNAIIGTLFCLDYVQIQSEFPNVEVYFLHISDEMILFMLFRGSRIIGNHLAILLSEDKH